MNPNPFDWPAEPFLMLYGALALALLAVGLVLRASIGSGSARRPQLNALEWAYLAGGAERVCDVALLCLASANAATVDKSGRIEVTDVSPLRALGADTASSSFGGVTSRKSFKSALGATTDRMLRRLQALGLAPTDAEVSALRAALLAPLGLLLAFGAARVYLGAERHHPVGFLLAMMFGLTICAALMVSRPVRTRAGSEALKSHRSANARAARAPLDKELLLAVALGGTVLLSGTAYASIHRVSQSSNDSSGSGCGSGGCGGGGCGGCS